MQRVPEEEKFSIVFVQLLKSQTIELPSLFIVDNIPSVGYFFYDFFIRMIFILVKVFEKGTRWNEVDAITGSRWLHFLAHFRYQFLSPQWRVTLAHRSLNRYLVYLFYFFCHVNAILFRETLPQQSYNKGGIISAALIVNFLEIVFFFTSLFKRKTRLEVSARANFHDHFWRWLVSLMLYESRILIPSNTALHKISLSLRWEYIVFMARHKDKHFQFVW